MTPSPDTAPQAAGAAPDAEALARIIKELREWEAVDLDPVMGEAADLIEALAAKPVTALAGGERERIEERLNALQNSFGFGPVSDGATRDEIAKLETRLAALSTPPPPAGDRPADVGALTDEGAIAAQNAWRQAGLVCGPWWAATAEAEKAGWRAVAAARSTLSPKGEEALRNAVEGILHDVWKEKVSITEGTTTVLAALSTATGEATR